MSLDAFVYRQYHGIALALHLGRKLDREHAVEVEARLGLRIDAAGAPKEQQALLSDRSKLEAFADKLEIADTRVHGNIGKGLDKGEGDDTKGDSDKDDAGKRAWERSDSFIHQAAAIVRALRARIGEVETHFKHMVAATELTPDRRKVSGGQVVASRQAYDDAKRELYITLGSIGTGEERRVVDALYEEVYGTSLKFQLAQLSNLTARVAATRAPGRSAGNPGAHKRRRYQRSPRRTASAWGQPPPYSTFSASGSRAPAAATHDGMRRSPWTATSPQDPYSPRTSWDIRSQTSEPSEPS